MIKIGNALKSCVLLVGTVMGLYGINAVLPPLSLTPGAGAETQLPRREGISKKPSAIRQRNVAFSGGAALTPSWHMRGSRQIARRTTGRG